MKELVSVAVALSVCVFGTGWADVSIVARDGTYLGKLNCNRYDPKSISNPYGIYGSKYSAYSTNNEYGVYGSPYSTYSATNPYATLPPMVIDSNRGIIGNYTTNRYNNSVASPVSYGCAPLSSGTVPGCPSAFCIPSPLWPR